MHCDVATSGQVLAYNMHESNMQQTVYIRADALRPKPSGDSLYVYFVTVGGANYCEPRVCMYVCRFVRTHISKMTSKLHEI